MLMGKDRDTRLIREYEEKIATEERARREDKVTHEISNKELKRYAEHRRIHRGEQFKDDGGTVAPNGVTVKKRRIVQNDARLKKGLGENRWAAMELICAAFKMIAAGMGMRTFNPFRVPGGGADADAGAALMELYWRWAVDLQRRGLSHAMCIATAVEGKTLAEVQKDYRLGRLTVRNNLVACLDVAVEMGILKIRRKGESRE